MSDQIFVAAISAGGVLLGVCLSQVITLVNAKLNRKHERQVLLRQKYENLVDELSLTIKNITSFPKATNEERLETIVNARNVYHLSMIYFPELLIPSTTLLNAIIAIHVAYYDGRTSDVPDLKKKYEDARKTLESDIRKYSKTYT